MARLLFFEQGERERLTARVGALEETRAGMVDSAEQSADGWSATCTTAPSSSWSRCR